MLAQRVSAGVTKAGLRSGLVHAGNSAGPRQEAFRSQTGLRDVGAGSLREHAHSSGLAGSTRDQSDPVRTSQRLY